MRHIIDGYRFLMEHGFDDAARICLTHSFPFKNVQEAFGNWDCSDEEFMFVKDFLAGIEYNEYDLLVQLGDTLALPSGYCLLEKRMVDVALRYGTNNLTVNKWKKVFEIKAYFEGKIGSPIYTLLPGIVENTFGVSIEELT